MDGRLLNTISGRLNVEFINMKKEKRVKHLTVLAKRLIETNGEEYLSVKEIIMDGNTEGVRPASNSQPGFKIFFKKSDNMAQTRLTSLLKVRTIGLSD